MNKYFYIIEWYESVQDEDKDGYLVWFDSTKHMEVFEDESSFISKLRWLQDISDRHEDFGADRWKSVGTIETWSGEMQRQRY